MNEVLALAGSWRRFTLILLVLLLLAGLPIAVWLDLRNVSESALRHQASDLNSVITSMRGVLCHPCCWPRLGVVGDHAGRA